MQRGCLANRAQRKERTLFQTQAEVGAALSVAGVDVAIGGQQHFANLGVFTLSGIVQGCALPSETENQANAVEKHQRGACRTLRRWR